MESSSVHMLDFKRLLAMVILILVMAPPRFRTNGCANPKEKFELMEGLNVENELLLDSLEAANPALICVPY